MTVALGAVIAVGQVATIIGAFAFDAASGAMASGSYARARMMLDISVTVDPAMALYRRERGAAALLAGNATAAVPDLEAAVALNPADDVAYRVLAEARLASGDVAGGLAAARLAVRRDASDPRNLIVEARTAAAFGDASAARDALIGAALHAPWITADPVWLTLVPSGFDAAELHDTAAQRWQAGAAPWLQGTDPAWLVAIAQDQAAGGAAMVAAGPLRATAFALMQLMDCETQAEGVDSLRVNERSQAAYGEYWRIRIFADRLSGVPENEEALPTAYLRLPQLETVAQDRVPVADLFGGEFKDQYGYRRRSMDHRADAIAPSTFGGQAAWLNHPDRASAATGMDGSIAACPR